MPRKPPSPAAVQAAAYVLTHGVTVEHACQVFGSTRFAVRSIMSKRVRFAKPTPGLEHAYHKLHRLFECSPLEFDSCQDMVEEFQLSDRTIRRWLWSSGQAKDAMLHWRRVRRERVRQEMLEQYRQACCQEGRPLPLRHPRGPFWNRYLSRKFWRYFPSFVHFQSEAQLPRWVWDSKVSLTYLKHEHALTRKLAAITRLPRSARPKRRWLPLVELAQHHLPSDHHLQPALALFQRERHATRIATKRRIKASRAAALDVRDVQGVEPGHRGGGLGTDAEGTHSGEGVDGVAHAPGQGGTGAALEGEEGQDGRS